MLVGALYLPRMSESRRPKPRSLKQPTKVALVLWASAPISCLRHRCKQIVIYSLICFSMASCSWKTAVLFVGFYQCIFSLYSIIIVKIARLSNFINVYIPKQKWRHPLFLFMWLCWCLWAKYLISSPHVYVCIGCWFTSSMVSLTSRWWDQRDDASVS